MTHLYMNITKQSVYINQIGYIIAKRRWRSSIITSKSWPSTDCVQITNFSCERVQVKLRKKEESLSVIWSPFSKRTSPIVSKSWISLTEDHSNYGMNLEKSLSMKRNCQQWRQEKTNWTSEQPSQGSPRIIAKHIWTMTWWEKLL